MSPYLEWLYLMAKSTGLRPHQKREGNTKMSNDYLTSGIKISTDSAGCMTAEHTMQGLLIDGSFYASRKECRAAAVKVLKEMKEQGSYESYEWQERRLEREENAWKYI